MKKIFETIHVQENCGTCRFFRRQPGLDGGNCVRYPPSIQDDECFSHGFINVTMHMYCGEWNFNKEIVRSLLNEKTKHENVGD